MNGHTRGDTQLGPFELVVLGAAAAVLVVEGGLWLWAGTAGALFGSGWPHLSLGALWHALAGVAGHLSDPRQGFPVRARGELPGPTGFYAALVLVAVLAGLAAAGAVVLWGRVRPGGLAGSKKHGARWAGGGDLARLRRGRRQRSSTNGARQASSDAEVLGLSLGYRGIRLLRAEDRYALLVFGPTQSGKSAGIAIPNVLEWSGATARRPGAPARG